MWLAPGNGTSASGIGKLGECSYPGTCHCGWTRASSLHLQPVSLAELVGRFTQGKNKLTSFLFWGVLFHYTAIRGKTMAVALCGSLCFLLAHGLPLGSTPPVLMGPPTSLPEAPTGARMSPSSPLSVQTPGAEKYTEKCNQLLCAKHILKMSFVISIQIVLNMKEIICMF